MLCRLPQIIAGLAYESTTSSVSGANSDSDGSPTVPPAVGIRYPYWMTSEVNFLMCSVTYVPGKSDTLPLRSVALRFFVDVFTIFSTGILLSESVVLEGLLC